MPDTNGARMLTVPETRLANRAAVSRADRMHRSSNARPPRRYYHLTSDGELALASFTTPWTVFRYAVEQILSEGSQQ
jgi:DNA-binding PadR family transcriptional regulator